MSATKKMINTTEENFIVKINIGQKNEKYQHYKIMVFYSTA